MPRVALRSICLRVLLPFLLTGFMSAIFAQQPALVIRGGTLIDGTGKAAVPNTVIVIEKNKIVAVGRQEDVTYPQNASVIDASGKFILPGLIDLHVHWRDWMPEMFLARGITSVVDLSSTEWVLVQKKVLAEGLMRGPRLFAATLSIGGRLLWDTPSYVPADTVEQARRETQAFGPGREKYNLTKVYTELTPDELRVIVEEAHKAGRNVIGHLGSLDVRQAAEAGIDAVAHASGVALATITDPVKADELRSFVKLGIGVDYPLYMVYHAFMDPQKIDELIPLLIRKKVRIEVDLANIARWATPRREGWLAEDARFLQNPNVRYIPFVIRDKALYTKPLERLTSEQREQLKQGYANLQSFLRKFVQAGGTMLAGSDEASFILPGISFQRELQLMVDAGLTPMQAIQAATKNNAEFLQENELGTIQPGKLADLIIVKANPLVDIENIQKLEVVIKDGEVMDTSYHADFRNPVPFPVQPSKVFPNPRPTIRALYPVTTKNLNKDVTVIVEGTNLVDESVVEVDGEAIATTPAKSTMLRETMFQPVYTQLTATIPARLLNRVGTYTLIVRNPAPDGGVSQILDFFVAP